MIFSTTLLAQALVSGTLIGGVFALIAVGLTLIWGVMRIINFAHGEFLMIGMYIAYFLVATGHWNPYLTIFVTVPALFLFGVVIFRTIIHPILKYPAMNQIMLTLGLSLILQNLALVIFKADVLTVQTPYSRLTIPLGEVIVRVPQAIAFAGSGIDVERTFLLAFGIGSACLGVAASLMVPFYYTSPTVGLFFGLIAFVVVVLGGMGNFLGALVAGLIIGLTEAVGAALLPGTLARVLTFGIFTLALLFRPQGIFGGRQQ